ncbi:MAG: DUF2061 domain-containing protein [Candidatus Lokiarchaeota archaeon]|nr:DUF2061 domain-containing protein [Candidatus Lokiarchaeota archaeon]
MSKNNNNKKKDDENLGLTVKESLIKSIVYRIITIFLGFFSAFLITGNIATAFGVALLTEFIQFINYFAYEVIWTKLRTKKKIEEEIIKRMIDLEINYDSILQLAYEMSQVDTFIREVYDSANNFFKSVLKNEQLKDLKPEISKYYTHFKHSHKDRQFTTYESAET